jgi:hypothetical protein
MGLRAGLTPDIGGERQIGDSLIDNMLTAYDQGVDIEAYLAGRCAGVAHRELTGALAAMIGVRWYTELRMVATLVEVEELLAGVGALVGFGDRDRQAGYVIGRKCKLTHQELVCSLRDGPGLVEFVRAHQDALGSSGRRVLAHK